MLCRAKKLCTSLGDRRREPIYNNPHDKRQGHFVTFDGILSEHRPDKEQGDGYDLAVEEARPKLKQPSLYRVVLINDDFTPMEFVVYILESIFGMERTRATQVMLEVHTKGKGLCGVYNFEIAETKVAQVMGIAQQHEHPLLCEMEES